VVHYPNHLNTPRIVADATGTTVWRWDQAEPFADSPADENPSGLGTFNLPLRLPGQYYDNDTNTAYNYFRIYDPGIGRYVRSDPIGIAGGRNLFAYVGSTPLGSFDFLGLLTTVYRGPGNYFSDIPPTGPGCTKAVWLGDLIQWVPCTGTTVTARSKALGLLAAACAKPVTTGGSQTGQASGTPMVPGSVAASRPPTVANTNCMTDCMEDALRRVGIFAAKELAIDLVIGRGLQAAVARQLIAEGTAALTGSAVLVGTGVFIGSYATASAVRCLYECD